MQRDTGCECASQTTTRKNIRYVSISRNDIASRENRTVIDLRRSGRNLVSRDFSRKWHESRSPNTHVRKRQGVERLVKGKRAAEIRVSRSMMMSLIRVAIPVGCCVDPFEWDTRYTRAIIRNLLFALVRGASRRRCNLFRLATRRLSSLSLSLSIAF